MEKKLLSSVHDFDDLLYAHSGMRYGDYCAGNNPPTSYPAVIIFEFHDGGDSDDYCSWEYVYPSDFELT